ncbi:MAG: (2Fe-2S)-binding protein [Lysobacter sp.]|nr:(2Fe-2S)-binding protein [Lysobacter sp.]
MYVCICNAVTEHDIRQAADAGCGSVAEMTMRTGAGSNCGSCLDLVAEMLGQSRAVRELPLPLLRAA